LGGGLKHALISAAMGRGSTTLNMQLSDWLKGLISGFCLVAGNDVDNGENKLLIQVFQFLEPFDLRYCCFREIFTQSRSGGCLTNMYSKQSQLFFFRVMFRGVKM